MSALLAVIFLCAATPNLSEGVESFSSDLEKLNQIAPNFSVTEPVYKTLASFERKLPTMPHLCSTIYPSCPLFNEVQATLVCSPARLKVESQYPQVKSRRCLEDSVCEVIVYVPQSEHRALIRCKQAQENRIKCACQVQFPEEEVSGEEATAITSLDARHIDPIIPLTGWWPVANSNKRFTHMKNLCSGARLGSCFRFNRGQASGTCASDETRDFELTVVGVTSQRCERDDSCQMDVVTDQSDEFRATIVCKQVGHPNAGIIDCHCELEAYVP